MAATSKGHFVIKETAFRLSFFLTWPPLRTLFLILILRALLNFASMLYRRRWLCPPDYFPGVGAAAIGFEAGRVFTSFPRSTDRLKTVPLSASPPALVVP